MPGPKTKRNISRIIPICLIWLTASLIYSLLERGLLGDLTYYPSTGNLYNFQSTIFITATAAFFIGLLVGTIEILYLHKLFRRRSLSEKIIYKTIIYLLINISFLFITTSIYNAVVLKHDVWSVEVRANVTTFFLSLSFWSVQVYIAAVIGICLFYMEVSDNLGQGVLNNFFTGKYHRPKIEERIFMFLDMKSSTTIAENIGHVRYFELLKEYYSYLTDPILDFAGEIYQYVGDEVVVSWRLKRGLQDNNCIACFYAMQESLKRAESIHLEKYGTLPGFKAGLHVGQVTTGEIGTLKKEIVFTGDVLNTTSRIQGLCNSLHVDLLISGQLLELLQPDDRFTVLDLAEHHLKGRDEAIKLYSLVRKLTLHNAI
jgi:adenylate cyclase